MTLYILVGFIYSFSHGNTQMDALIPRVFKTLEEARRALKEDYNFIIEKFEPEYHYCTDFDCPLPEDRLGKSEYYYDGIEKRYRIDKVELI